MCHYRRFVSFLQTFVVIPLLSVLFVVVLAALNDACFVFRWIAFLCRRDSPPEYRRNVTIYRKSAAFRMFDYSHG